MKVQDSVNQFFIGEMIEWAVFERV